MAPPGRGPRPASVRSGAQSLKLLPSALPPPPADRGGASVPRETGRAAASGPAPPPAGLSPRAEPPSPQWGNAAALTAVAGGGGSVLGRACGAVLAPPGAGQGCVRSRPASPRTCRTAVSVLVRGVRVVREVPTFRLTLGANLEAAGVLELEEEKEEEEAAAARRARSFAEDARVRFLGGRLELMLGLSAEKWSQHLESEDHRQVLAEFLESPGPACLVFSVAAPGRLSVSREVRSAARPA